MQEINNINCILLFKYERAGSNKQEIILVWPYEYDLLRYKQLLKQLPSKEKYINFSFQI